MICSKCGTTIRKDSVFCHKCGSRVVQDAEEVIRSAESEAAEDAVSGTAQVQTAMQSAEKTPEQTQGVRPAADEYDEYFKYDEEEPKKKKKGLIIGAVIAVAAICIVCFCCSNTFKRTFYKPENYYKYVEKKNAKDKIRLVTGWYDSGNLLVPGGGSVGFEDTMSLKMSDDILDDASEALGVYGITGYDQDLSWLQDISISGKTTMYDNLTGRNTSVNIGADTVFTLNTVGDQDSNKMYVRIPELSDSYIGFDVSKLDNLTEIVQNYTDTPVTVGSGMYDYVSMSKSLPEAYKLSRIMTKYSDIFFDNMNNVTKSGKQKLEMGGVAEKCYCLTVDFDYKDMKSLGRQFREELSSDDDVKEAYINLMEADGKNGEESWNDLVDELYVLEDILGELAGSSMNVYVDTCGHIIAREFIPAESDAVVRYGRTINGRTFGAQFVVNVDGDDIVALRGSGKKAGQNYAGDFKLSLAGSEPVGVTLDSFDYAAFRKQKINAQMTVGIKDIAEALDIRDDSLDFINDYKTVINVDTPGAGSYNTKIRLTDGVSDPVVIDYSYKKTGGSRISVPEDAMMIEGIGDLKTYIKEADFARLRDNLQNAGVPSSVTKYITYVEKAADYLDYIDLFL